MSKRWVKYPGPGEFRGEGEWMPVESINFLDTTVDEGWQYLKETNYLPTYVGENPNNEGIYK